MYLGTSFQYGREVGGGNYSDVVMKLINKSTKETDLVTDHFCLYLYVNWCRIFYETGPGEGRGGGGGGELFFGSIS